MVQGLQVLASACPSVFLELYHYFFLNFGVVLETHLKLSVTEPDFPENFFCPQKWAKKQGFLNLLSNFVIIFFNLFYNEHLYYLLCSSTNPIFDKIFVPEIWAKMISANQIAGFFNQQYLQTKSMKQTDFLHFDTNSHKLKVDENILEWARSEVSVTSLVTRL